MNNDGDFSERFVYVRFTHGTRAATIAIRMSLMLSPHARCRVKGYV